MDGTIVDTEPYWIEAEHALVAAHGGQWSHEQALQLVGQSLVFSAGILQEAGVKLERREIIDTLTDHVISQVRTSVPWRPGARELLDELHTAGIRCVLVTMSEAPLAREIVASLPEALLRIPRHRGHRHPGQAAPRGLPDGRGLLQRAGPELGLHHCVALEDSGPGVAAAVASGVATVAIPHIVPLPARSPPRHMGHPGRPHRGRPRRARGPAPGVPGRHLRAGAATRPGRSSRDTAARG